MTDAARLRKSFSVFSERNNRNTHIFRFYSGEMYKYSPYKVILFGQLRKQIKNNFYPCFFAVNDV